MIEISQGETAVAGASRTYDLTPSEVETWVDDAKKVMENSLRAMPQNIHAQYEK